MKVTFLGTGTSVGVPMIGCDCEACTSLDSRDNRLRTSIFIEDGDQKIVIDIGPDFRQQMLRAKIRNIDYVLLTHEHNDHMIGVDDLRPFNFIQRKDMPIYGEKRVLDEIQVRFEYAFIPHPYPGIPQFRLNVIKPDKSFFLGETEVAPIRLMHGSLPIFGFRFGDFCYLTDVKTIPDSEFKKLKGIKVLVLNALRRKAHHSHLTLEEAIEMAKKIGAETTYFTHISHDLGAVSRWELTLPNEVKAAYDGMVINL